MTKKAIAEEILQNSSLHGVNERLFYKQVAKTPKVWLENAYTILQKTKIKEQVANLTINLMLQGETK